MYGGAKTARVYSLEKNLIIKTSHFIPDRAPQITYGEIAFYLKQLKSIKIIICLYMDF